MRGRWSLAILGVILILAGGLRAHFTPAKVMSLSTIIAIQFVPLLAICAVIATFTWRRTGPACRAP